MRVAVRNQLSALSFSDCNCRLPLRAKRRKNSIRYFIEMTLESWLLYLLLVIVATATPGPFLHLSPGSLSLL